jgi:RimJ/RimL family protein N-acetyltransferase
MSRGFAASGNPHLETERLRLVPWRMEHLGELSAIFADADNLRFVGGALSRENSYFVMQTRAGHLALKGFGVLAVEERATGHLLGWCGPRHPIDIPERDLIYTFARQFHGKGFAQEAATAALKWCFGPLGFDRMAITIDPENAPSIRVAERAGAQLEDRKPFNEDKELLVYRCYPAGFIGA